ncbi:unnamed protein product [Caenorhabditis angaria]|uniref:Uncharacterized protein n=1 Tax=Caenorhabditis angaria TaxID=860376 RepID=A0A9P1IU21_9PELO|nr:unnamed protein product [Caenorhabditis angaria]
MLRSLLVICTIFVIFVELAPVSDDTLELELESNITVVKLDKGLKFEAHSKFDSDNSTTSKQSEKEKPQHPTNSSSEEIHDPSVVSGRAVRSVDKKERKNDESSSSSSSSEEEKNDKEEKKSDNNNDDEKSSDTEKEVFNAGEETFKLGANFTSNAN